MAFDKAKVLRAAEKFLSQGKIAAAIKEYREIVDHDEDDFTTLNMLGDLYVRAERKEEAIPCFLLIAEHYREQDFTLKAIAMYKKIDRINPHDPEIANKLGALYAVNGLAVDARSQYLIVADAHSRAGRSKEALAVLHKIADLEPNNIDIRLKLAEGYLKEGLRPEAAEAFSKAAFGLLELGSFERARQAFSQALVLRGRHKESLQGLLSAHVALGTANEVAQILERAVEETPEDVELLSMLVQAYLEAGDPLGAERATSLLSDQDGSNYPRFVDVARLYLKSGDVPSAVRVATGITEQMLAGRGENDLLALVNEALEREPKQVQALHLLVRIHWWRRDMEKLRSALDRLVESARETGQQEEERYALTQLVRIAPEESEHAQRLYELGGAPEETAEEPVDPAVTEVPMFETFAMADEHPGTPVDGASEFESNSVATETFRDPSASFADLNQDSTGASASLPDVSAAPTLGSTSFQDIDFSTAVVDSSPAPPIRSSGPLVDPVKREAMMRQELDSVDFYLTQGYFDIAADTLAMLERQFGHHKEIDARRQKVNEGGAVPAESSRRETLEFGGAQELEGPDKGKVGETSEIPHVALDSVAASLDASARGIDPGLAEIFEEFRMATEEEKAPPLTDDYETHYNMGIAYKEMDLLDDAIQEFQLAAGLANSHDGTPFFLQCCNMLGHCFVQKGLPRAAVMWFKKGLDSPGHSEEEYLALRYELGSAYEQMGDVRQAIEVLTEVYGTNISYRGVGDKLRSLQEQKVGEGKES